MASSDNSSKFSGKFRHEAMFYSYNNGIVKCELCPNYCILKPGKFGLCRNRANEDGKLVTAAYGNPCALHIDPIEKKPLYHFMPGTKIFSLATGGCNFSCLNCQNWAISQQSANSLKTYSFSPQQIVDECVSEHCSAIAYTYTEPTIFYEYMYDTAKLARQKGIRNVMISNGYINPEPLKELLKYIDAANIDLKNFSEDIYKKLSGGKLSVVLNTLKILKEAGVWVEITYLIIPSLTDDIQMIREMCNWLYENGFSESPLHFSRFSPTYKLMNLPVTPVSALEMSLKTATEAGLKYVYVGNIANHKSENTFCPSCHSKIIERRGFAITDVHVKEGLCGFCHHPIPGVWQ